MSQQTITLFDNTQVTFKVNGARFKAYKTFAGNFEARIKELKKLSVGALKLKKTELINEYNSETTTISFKNQKFKTLNEKKAKRDAACKGSRLGAPLTKQCADAKEDYDNDYNFIYVKHKNVDSLSIAKLSLRIKEVQQVINEKTKSNKPLLVDCTSNSDCTGNTPICKDSKCVTEEEGAITIDNVGKVKLIPRLTKAEINEAVEDYKNTDLVRQRLDDLKKETLADLRKGTVPGGNEILRQDTADTAEETVGTRNLWLNDLEDEKAKAKKIKGEINDPESKLTKGQIAIKKTELATVLENQDNLTKSLNQNEYLFADVDYEKAKINLSEIKNVIAFKVAQSSGAAGGGKKSDQGNQAGLDEKGTDDSGVATICNNDDECPADKPICKDRKCTNAQKKSAKQITEESFQEKLAFDIETVRLAALQLKPKNRIFNLKNYDVSRLRFIENLDKYLEDPIAFITNHVWNYNFPSSDVATFNFRASESILSNINEQTFTMMQETFAIIANDFEDTIQALSGGDSNLYNVLTDLYFINEFSSRIRAYLKKLYNGADLSAFEIETENIFVNKNQKFLWFWINQLFVKNVTLFQRDNEGNGHFKINVDSKSYVPLGMAFYFMLTYYEFIDRSENNPNPPNISINKLFYKILLPNRKKSLYTYDSLFIDDFFNLVAELKYENTNNYINLKSIPEVDYTTVVQIYNSAFFSKTQEELQPGEKKSLSNVKKVKRCKETPQNKKETSLKLFYKDGNDNILDKKKPAGGLGCSTETLEWETAENIIFNGDSILQDKKRVNYTLPYYNLVKYKGATVVPPELDILKINLEEAQKKNKNIDKLLGIYRTFASQLLLDITGKKQSEVLIDNSLVEDIEKNRASTGQIINSFFSKSSPSWGGDKPLSGNREFQEEKFVEKTYAPYVGIFPVGYSVTKTDFEETAAIQRFLNNVVPKSSNEQLKTYEESVFEISDSQIKYATGYKYFLESILSMSEIAYGYESIKLSQTANIGKVNELKKEIEDIIAELEKIKEDKKTAGFTELGSLIAKELQKNAELSIKKFSLSVSLETEADSAPIFIKFKTNDLQYKNSIEEIITSNVDIPISYVDLPPTPLFMQVYPKRGVNDKIILTFKGYSLENKIQTVKIPKKYWTDGWQDSKEFFVKSFKNFSKETLNSFGIEDDKVEDDEMFFTDQPIEKIKLYFSEGVKPKDVLDLQEYPVEINVINQGFTKELDLKPNTKYYFAAKGVSFTGLLSEFSQVYEIELVDDAGAVFPVVNVVDLEEKEKRVKKISFSKKFRIQPALLQQAPNPKKNDIGYLTPSVFSPSEETRTQFKIRLTSKKTGKKVDFNVIYRKSFAKAAEDIAGKINLENATKENVLISYNAGLAEAALAVGPQAIEKQTENLQKLIGMKIPNPFGIPPDQDEDSEPVLATPCCSLDDKPPLYPSISVSGEDTWTATPGGGGTTQDAIFYKTTNIKLQKIDKVISQFNEDEDAVYAVLKSMGVSEKCYMCKRKAEYEDISMLGAIEQQFNEKEFNNVLNILNCKEYGFASRKGGNPLDNNGNPLNISGAVAKCNTSKKVKLVQAGKPGSSGLPKTVIRDKKWKKEQDSKQVKVKQGTLGKKFVPNDKVVTGGRPPELEPK